MSIKTSTIKKVLIAEGMIFVIMLISYFVIANYIDSSKATEATNYNKLSSCGSFYVNEFFDTDIPSDYLLIDNTSENKYSDNYSIVAFSDGSSDLLFNITDNLDLLTDKEVSENLANGFIESFKVGEVKSTSITSSSGYEIPIITFEMDTNGEHRIFQYATLNSGYKTILVSMNSLDDQSKIFSNVVSSIELK